VCFDYEIRHSVVGGVILTHFFEKKREKKAVLTAEMTNEMERNL
jgi:hypothetical protein